MGLLGTVARFALLESTKTVPELGVPSVAQESTAAMEYQAALAAPLESI